MSKWSQLRSHRVCDSDMTLTMILCGQEVYDSDMTLTVTLCGQGVYDSDMTLTVTLCGQPSKGFCMFEF